LPWRETLLLLFYAAKCNAYTFALSLSSKVVCYTNILKRLWNKMSNLESQNMQKYEGPKGNYLPIIYVFYYSQFKDKEMGFEILGDLMKVMKI
jgi:hypothetical protein